MWRSWAENYVIAGEANNGKDGFELIKQLQPDLAFVDINMPMMSGLELLEALKQEGIPCKIVILTGYSEFEYAQKAIRFGVWDYLLKPIDKKQLGECLQQIEKQINSEKQRAMQYKELAEKAWINGNELSSNFVEKIINFESEDDWDKVLQTSKSFPGISEKESYQVLLIRIYFEDTDYWKAADLPLCNFVIMNVLKELCEGKKTECIAGNNRREYICVILYSEQSAAEMDAAVKRLLRKFYNILQHRLGLSVLFCCGSVKDTLKKCKESYSEAYAVYQHKLLYREKGAYYSIQTENVLQKTGVFSGNKAVQLMAYLRADNRDGIDKLLDGIFEEMKQEKTAPEFVLLHVNDIISCVLEFAGELQIQISGEGNNKNFHLPDFSKKSIDEISATIKRYVHNILDIAHSNPYERSLLLPEKVITYIMEHFQCSELGLEKITKVFGISKTVLCQQFRDTAKMTIGEYILQVRMHHAKELLDEGYSNVAFIAEKCGYDDAGYFTKRFKKYFGLRQVIM